MVGAKPRTNRVPVQAILPLLSACEFYFRSLTRGKRAANYRPREQRLGSCLSFRLFGVSQRRSPRDGEAVYGKLLDRPLVVLDELHI